MGSSTAPMGMVPTLTPTLVSTTDMPDTMLDTLMPTTARGPLMLSQRPMLMPTTTEPMDWDTTVLATEHTGKDSPSAPGWQSLAEVKWRVEAGLEVSSQALNLKLTQSVLPQYCQQLHFDKIFYFKFSSQKQVLSLTFYVVNIFFSDTDTLTLIMASTTARGPLMLSPPPLPSLRLMPTTATTVMLGPTATVTDTEATEATTGDKFSASEVQSRSSKRTSLLVI